ncbi:MAG: hypothetical protein ABI361_00635 [Nitrososphaera sp.]|jgi:hypothetical protein
MSQNVGKQKTNIGRKSKLVISTVAVAALLFLAVAIANGGLGSAPGGKSPPVDGGQTSHPAIKGLRALDNEHCVNKLGGPALC